MTQSDQIIEALETMHQSLASLSDALEEQRRLDLGIFRQHTDALNAMAGQLRRAHPE
jgi:hypothetical protein